jgi:hypothetical protein
MFTATVIGWTRSKNDSSPRFGKRNPAGFGQQDILNLDTAAYLAADDSDICSPIELLGKYIMGQFQQVP